MSTTLALDSIGVGIDTARYGHRVSFLRPDRSPAAAPLTVMENRAGYKSLEDRLSKLRLQHPQAHFHIRIDAAGQYAVNIEQFIRGLGLPMTLSIGEPKRNKDYRKAHFPKRTTDDTESQAMARFAVVERPAATSTPSTAAIMLRDVCGRLQTQVKQTTQAVNRLHNLLARAFPELATLTDDIAAGWVLRLLEKYPTAERIAGARVGSLLKIPYMLADTAQAVQSAARQSVATLRGTVAEELIRTQVAQVQSSKEAEKDLKKLLTTAYDDLPASGHLRLVTIPGIGETTAAILVAKIIDIKRFATADQLVNYFGLFPEENSSGVDKQGQPLPSGAMHMSQKGNDLVRGYLWNAARVAILHNPAIKPLYYRLKSRGKRGDVAPGPPSAQAAPCGLRRLEELISSFEGDHFPWANPDAAKPATPPSAPAKVVPSKDENGTAVGHKRDMPARKVVTTATVSVEPTSSPVKPAAPPTKGDRPPVDFAFLRERVTISQVLQHLNLLGRMHCRGPQLRGPCPIHGQPKDSSRTFSVHVGKNVFRCFNATCGAQGNVLDLWAAIHKLPLYEAALNLAKTFGLSLNREEEPVKRNPSSQEKAAAAVGTKRP